MLKDGTVLIVHTSYVDPGGEDAAFENDVQLLRRNGHTVISLPYSNRVMLEMGRARASATMVWNAEAARAIAAMTRKHDAQVVHFHNTFPLLSPAVYGAAGHAGAAVVQTLHNYRLMCPAGTFFRNGAPCELCAGRIPWRAAAYACYRNSHTVGAAVATMTQIHRVASTWLNNVDAYIALTEFGRDMFVRGGLPAKRVHVRPNFLLHDPGRGTHDGGFVLYAGRLAEEKGIEVLLAAALLAPEVRIVIAGDGPLRGAVERAVSHGSGVEYRGMLSGAELGRLMSSARALVVPSLWYEGYPMVVAEALARGTPLVASEIGALGSIVREADAGWMVPAGNAPALADKMNAAMADDDLWSAKSDAARRTFVSELSPDAAYLSLLAIYEAAMAEAVQRRGV